MKNKSQLVPRLRFPEFANAGDWEVKKLGVISEIVRGGSPRPIEDFLTTSNDGLNWLKIGDVSTESKYITQTKEKVIPAALTKTREVHTGDLILSNSMSFGRPYILKIPACIHDGWIAITKLSNHIDRDYLYYLISSEISQNYFFANAAGAVVQNLNVDIIKQLPILLPSLPEQQKIADCLTSLDELIALHSQKLEALTSYKKGLLQQLFPAEGATTPSLRFPEFADAGAWEEKKLGDVSNRITEKVGEVQLIPVSITAGYGFVSQKSKFGRDISGEQYKNYIFLRRGDFAYNRGNSKKYPQGYVCQLTEFDQVAASTAFLCFRLKDKYKADFIQGLFDKNIHGQQLAKYITSSARSDGLLNISSDDFFNITLLIPSLAEQQKIADCLTSLDELIAAQGQKLEALKAHKRGLLQQLFPANDEDNA